MELQIAELQARLAERKLAIRLTEAARDHLAERGFDPTYGARPLKRLIQREVADALATKVLSGEVREGDEVEVDLGGAGLEFRTVRA